jgi:GNAT superfamily N-acetyltransferase
MTSPEDYRLQRVGPDSVEGLLAGCFPVPEGASFFDDFPIWRHRPDAEWLAVESDRSVIACAGVVPGSWSLPGGRRLRVGRIGGVATHESLRGQGVASLLVEALIDRSRSLGLDAVVLWGTESPLYTRLGFTSRGVQLRAAIAPLLNEASRAPAALRLQEGFDGILALMQEARTRCGGIALEPSDAAWLSEHRNTHWARVLDASGKPVAYGAFARGIDLGLQLHDWWGDGEALMMLLRWAVSIDPSAEIMGPGSLLSKKLGGSGFRETACLMLPLRPEVEKIADDDIWFWGLDGV